MGIQLADDALAGLVPVDSDEPRPPITFGETVVIGGAERGRIRCTWREGTM